MNRRLLAVLLLLAGIGVSLSVGFFKAHSLFGARPVAVAAEDAKAESSGPPPLVIDEDSPLLLDEPTDAEKKAAKRKGADNSACFVCHVNYEKEPMALQHAAQDIGCVACHGKSFAHRNDENNTTPPEVMYPSGKINAACRKCHKTHDVPAAKVIALWLKRCPKKNPKTVVCTDCHGNHRLKVRTVRWNKKTGKLLLQK